MSLISRPVRPRSPRGVVFGEWIQEGMGRVRFRQRRARGETFVSAIRGCRLAGRLARVLLFLLGSLAGSAQDHARNESWRWAHYGSEPGLPFGAVIDVAETTGGVWEVQFGEPGKLWAGTSRGLAAYRDGVLSAFEAATGFAHDRVWPILQVGDRVYADILGGGPQVLSREEAAYPTPRISPSVSLAELADFSVPLPYDLHPAFLALALFWAASLAGFALVYWRRCRRHDRESESYVQILEQVHDAVVSTDLEGKIETWNAGAERIYGYRRAEVLGEPLAIIFFFEDGIRLMSDVLVPTREKHLHELACRTRQRDGREIFSLLRLSVRRQDEVPAGYIVCCSDITERKRAEARLDQARKMEAVGTLAGGVAHEFNNLLGPIIGLTQLVEERLPANSENRNDLKTVLDASRRAKDLVHQILAFSRPSTTDRKTVQVGPLVQDVLKLLRATLPATVEIRSTIGVDSGCIYANSTLIHQILVNLCTNACHAMGASGGLLEVTVTGLEAGSPELAKLGGSGQRGGVKISVRDTGEGIPPAVRKHIFEPFFTTKCQGEGTGLGLSVVHEIVTNHGGVIEVDSKPGASTTFRVYLPQTGAREASATAAAPSRSAGGERILVVDDEEPIIKLSRRMLERQGYQVLALTSSEEALELFQSGPGEFDLVLSDVSLPELSGIDLARALIGIRPDIPVILMTGFTEMIREEAAQDMGVRALLRKPFSPRAAIALIQQTLAETPRRARTGRAVPAGAQRAGWQTTSARSVAPSVSPSASLRGSAVSMSSAASSRRRNSYFRADSIARDARSR